MSNATIAKIHRSDFPNNFVFGSATSAYQVEGAWNADGKSPSNWDVFTTRTPCKIHDKKNARTAIDQYHRIKEDVAIIKSVGLDSYRFSIAWTRVLQWTRVGGRLRATENPKGIAYYKNMIELLHAEGIKPCATIFHWDVPQCLEEEYGGFLNHQIVNDFCTFANVCFREFGDRVKLWITLNEPWAFAYEGYVTGHFPPARDESSMRPVNAISLHRGKPGAPAHCSKRKPGKEPYIVAHNLILSHAKAVNIYRKNYQERQKGKIGITNVSQWFVPLHDTEEDKKAASRAIDFMLGWFVEPIVTGNYPLTMRARVGNRLPQFLPDEKKLVKESYDFLGINYYTSTYVFHSSSKTCAGTAPSYITDRQVAFSHTSRNVPIGPKGGSDWLNIVPYGIYKLLVYIKKKYCNPIIYITENGVDEVNNPSLRISHARIDMMRIKYHKDHLHFVKKAIDEERVRVQAYYIWSMFDNFEWALGYTVRFGIVYVDFNDGHLTRIPKKSAIWFKEFLNKKRLH